MVAQMVKHLPAMQETWVQSLGWKDPLEKEMTTHSSTLAWKMPWMGEPCKLQSMELQSRTRLSDLAAAAMVSSKSCKQVGKSPVKMGSES